MSAASPPRHESTEVLIVGSGFAGLCMAIRLKKAGLASFLILESADEIGGTWRDNRYPGCACDIPSHLYSFSFEPKSDWSRMYPTQWEIFEYLKHCVSKYRLEDALRFSAEVREMRYDEGAQRWQVAASDGRTFDAPVLVSAMGGLSRPAYPSIDGLDGFGGAVFHSARWDNGVDLSGKDVAVIGTGASAIQFVPQIAPQVRSLTLFQRTPPWIMPKLDRPIRAWEKRMFALVPATMRLMRHRIYWRQEVLALGFVVKPEWMAQVEKLARAHLARNISDTALRERLTPEYRIGCKRILISNDYLPALTRANVEVVSEAIARVTRAGVVDARGREYGAEVLILGTGFRATEMPGPVRVFGRAGLELERTWNDGAHAYYGLCVAGYPNLFLLTGPNTGLGHNSVVFMIEAQVRYVLSALRLLQSSGSRSLEVRAEVEHGFNQRLQERMAHTVWKSGCKSWYLDKRGRNVTLWPGFSFSYWLRTRHAAEGDYRLS